MCKIFEETKVQEKQLEKFNKVMYSFKKVDLQTSYRLMSTDYLEDFKKAAIPAKKMVIIPILFASFIRLNKKIRLIVEGIKV